MASLLSLVQDLWRESGSGGPEPQSVTNLNGGEVQRLLNWVLRADKEIQSLHADWQFLWRQASVSVVAGTDRYVAPVGLRQYDEATFKLDGNPIEVRDYLDVRGQILPTTPGKPSYATKMPDKTIRLEPVPADTHTLSYDYYIINSSFDLSLGNDAVTLIPDDYTQVIVGRALMHYANYEPAPELVNAASDLYMTWLQTLESDYLPGKRRAHKQSEGNLGIIVEPK